ncbi:MAG TPA: flagellar hook protein FlgE [Candidatus Kapabacteria bacterium]|nr:flagellar hook protein FlgE [Candidatus Kapabacteria bacterium]
MSLTRSLSVGTSALRANQQRMDVISNNLSNLNTIGYKSNRANFEEQFNQVVNHGKNPDVAASVGFGGVNPLQFGLGVKLGSITQDMSQGVTEITNRPLDMAIQGDGMFVFNINGEQKFSRAGNISRDRDGYLIDTGTGAYLQGYNIDTDSNGNIIKSADGMNTLTGLTGNLKVSDDVISPPRQTQNIRLTGNLNSGNTTGAEKKTSIKVFDNLGATHDLKFTFTKTANPGEYSLAGEIDGTAVTLSNTTVTFNSDGTLNTPHTINVTANDLNTALGTTSFDAGTPKDISITLANPNQLTSGLTGFSAGNTVSFVEQDGYQQGSLIDLSVDAKGQLWGAFTNGVSERVGQVVIAKFTNQEGLIRNGGNFYSTSPNSGLPNIGTAGEIFPSTKIAGNALEQSNVDMTVEFTNLISTQRAYEAAARTITVSDQILGETTILKR